MTTIFVQVSALVAAEYAHKVAPPEHQHDFFMNIGRESGTTLHYEATRQCWQLCGDLEGIGKAHQIMTAIQQLVGVPNYHCPAHAKANAIQATSAVNPIDNEIKPENSPVVDKGGLLEDGEISTEGDLSAHSQNKQLLKTHDTSESEDSNKDKTTFTPPKTRSKAASNQGTQMLNCADCGRKYHRKSHLLKHMQNKHGAQVENSSKKASSVDKKGKVSKKHLLDSEKLISLVPVQNVPRNQHQSAVQRIKDKYRSRFCYQCQKSFSTYSNLERHLKIIHAGFRYRCFDCSKVFTCRDTLDRHNKVNHQNLRCLKCLHLCQTDRERKRHVCANRRKDRMKCEGCNRMYSGSLSLHKHYRNYHKGVIFSCEFCAAACHSNPELFEHYLHCHNMYRCLECLAIFAAESEFSEHKCSTVDPGSIENQVVPGMKMISDSASTDLSLTLNDTSLDLSDQFILQTVLLDPSIDEQEAQTITQNIVQHSSVAEPISDGVKTDDTMSQEETVHEVISQNPLLPGEPIMHSSPVQSQPSNDRLKATNLNGELTSENNVKTEPQGPPAMKDQVNGDASSSHNEVVGSPADKVMHASSSNTSQVLPSRGAQNVISDLEQNGTSPSTKEVSSSNVTDENVMLQSEQVQSALQPFSQTTPQNKDGNHTPLMVPQTGQHNQETINAPLMVPQTGQHNQETINAPLMVPQTGQHNQETINAPLMVPQTGQHNQETINAPLMVPQTGQHNQETINAPLMVPQTGQHNQETINAPLMVQQTGQHNQETINAPLMVPQTGQHNQETINAPVFVSHSKMSQQTLIQPVVQGTQIQGNPPPPGFMFPSTMVMNPGYPMTSHPIHQNTMIQAVTDGNALIQDHMMQAQMMQVDMQQNSALLGHLPQNNANPGSRGMPGISQTMTIPQDSIMAGMPTPTSLTMASESSSCNPADTDAAPLTTVHEDTKQKILHKLNKQRTCDICNKVFSCSGNLSKHIRNIHNNKERLQCDMCPITFASQQQLTRHVRVVHHDALFNCHCNFQCGSRKDLVKHQLEAHGIQVSDDCYQCEICGKAFLYEHNLKRHVKKEHDALQCGQCDSSFITQQQLEDHREKVHGKPRATCDLCTKSYKTRQKLREHILSVHTSSMPFSCGKCGKRFNRQSSVSYHWRRCNGIKSGSGSESAQGSETESIHSEASRDPMIAKPEEGNEESMFGAALSNLSYPTSNTPSYPYNSGYSEMSAQSLSQSEVDLDQPGSDNSIYTLTTLTSVSEITDTKLPTMTSQQSQDTSLATPQSSEAHLTLLQPMPPPQKQSPGLHPLCDIKMENNLMSSQSPLLPQSTSLLQSLSEPLPFDTLNPLSGQFNMLPPYPMSAPLGPLLTSLIHDLPPPMLGLSPLQSPLNPLPAPLSPLPSPLSTPVTSVSSPIMPQLTNLTSPPYSHPPTSQDAPVTSHPYTYLNTYSTTGYSHSYSQMAAPDGVYSQASTGVDST